MPFISNGVYTIGESDSTWSSSIVQKTFVNLDTTFFINVINRYNSMMDGGRYIPNPFFVKNNVLYCGGYFGNPNDSSDTLLHWQTYDIQKKTYTDHTISTPYTFRYGNYCMIYPLRRISGLKFYFLIIPNAHKGYINTGIIDYEKNSVTVISKDLYNNYEFDGVYLSVNNKLFIGQGNSSSTYMLDLNSSSPELTSPYLQSGHIIGSRSNNSYTELIHVSYKYNSHSSGIEDLVFRISRVPYDESMRDFESNTENINSSNILGSSGDYWSVCPVYIKYDKIFLFWISYGTYTDLIVTGDTDYSNGIQPFRFLGSMQNEKFLSEDQNKNFYYDLGGSNGSVYSVNEVRPAFIPDLDDDIFYTIPSRTYGNSLAQSACGMVRVKLPILKTIAAKGGTIW